MRGGYALDRGADERGPSAAHSAARDRRPGGSLAQNAGAVRAVRRASISPEKLLRALLLQAFNSVRSERQLIEQLKYNLLFRCSPRTATVKVFFSDEHFLVGRTLIKAFASMKSFKPRTKAPTGTWGRRTRRSRWTSWERR
jgi:hypothetical protein